MKLEDKIAKKRILEKIKLIRASGGTINTNETKEEKNARIERAKKDYRFMMSYYFPHYASVEAADFHVDFAKMVWKNPVFKGFAEWGRGLAKSVVVDISLPFSLWLRGEQVYMVVIGSSGDKAKQLLEDIRLEFEVNPRIIADFGEQKNLGSWENGFFKTTSGFIGQALGVGQSCRGLRVGNLRPNYIVVDDIETEETINNEKRQNKLVKWIEKSLIPTMDGLIRRFIQANNAFAPVMIQKKLQERHPKWKNHHVKAYNPITYEPSWYQKYADDYYRELEDEIGILAALAEYNHEAHIEGEIFKDEDIQWTAIPRIDHFEMIVGHWDIAYAGTPTADYNAVRIWGLKNKQFYYITSFVRKTKMKAAVQFMADFQSLLPEKVIIHWQYESQFWNDAVQTTIEDVETENEIELGLVKVEVSGNKYSRILKTHPYYQNGRIWYNEKMKNHTDTIVGKAQLLGIEPGYSGHDDAPDADEQALKFLARHINTGKKGAPPMTGKVERKHQY